MPARPTIERVSQSAIHLPNPTPQSAFEDVRGILLRWLATKVGHDLPRDMAQGGTGIVDQIGSPRAETASLDEPVFWSFRNDDPDKHHPQRTWVTEASLAREPNGLVLGYRLHAANRGEPAPFERSVPRFVHDVGARYRACIDGVDAAVQAILVDPDDVEALIDLLENPRRAVPVVAVSMAPRNQGYGPLIDPDVIARKVFGAAHVRVLSWEASFALTRQLGKPLSVYGGAVRVWRAGDRVRGSDPYAHPLIFPDKKPLAADAIRSVAEIVLRESAIRRDADRLVPSFATVRGLVADLALQRARPDAPPSDLLRLYEDDNTRLVLERDEAKEELAAYVKTFDTDLTQIKEERDAAQDEVFILRGQVRFLEVRRGEALPVPPTDIPEDFDEMKAWADNALGPDVQILPRALRAAQDSHFEEPSLAFRALLLMRDAYVPMKRTGVTASKQQWEDGLRQLGLRLEPTFSGERAGQFGDEYFVRWKNQRRELDLHLKRSNSRNSRYVFRLYFFWCDVDRVPVVGWFPGHLTTDVT